MKVLLLNQDWWAKELRELGHEVLSYGDFPHLDVPSQNHYPHIDSLLSGLPNGFTPDVIIWLDNSAPVLIQGFENCPVPFIFYSVDTQHHYSLHAHIAKCVDHVLIAQKDYIPHFLEKGTPITWLPLWASRHLDPSPNKKHQATFVGTLNRNLNPNRVAFFEKLQTIAPVHVQSGDFADIFPHAEIIVNQTVKQDLNFRVFEAMMSGAMLLTEKTGNGLLELFEDGQHLVTYTPHKAEEAAERIQELLANPARMRAIAHAGREEILRKHTATARALHIHNLITTISKRPRQRDANYAAMINHAVVSSLTYQKTGCHAIPALVAALHSALQGLHEGIVPDDHQVCYLLRTATSYDAVLKTGAGASLLRQFAAKFPEQAILQLADIRLLLNAGDLTTARARAESLGAGTADDVFQKAEFTVTTLLQQSA